MVTLLVGPEEQEMAMHGDRLARNSPYFRAALREEWLEGQTHVIKLPDESPELMQHYVEFVYSDKPPANALTKDSKSQPSTRRHYKLPAKLYVVGERRLEVKFQNVITKELFRLVKLTGKGPGIGFVDIIYQGTTMNSPARRMVVDFAATGPSDYWLNPRFANSDHEFWYDLSVAFLRKAMSPVGPLKAEDYLVPEDA
jgi:hypothetical protein